MKIPLKSFNFKFSLTRQGCADSPGFSLIEVMVASSLLLVVAGGLGYVFNDMVKSQRKTQVVGAMAALESQLLAAMSNPDNYPTAVRNQLAAGTVPTALNLTVKCDGCSETNTWTIPANNSANPIFLDKDLKACTGFSATPGQTPPNPDCWFSVTLGLARNAAGFGYNYTITANSILAKDTSTKSLSWSNAGNTDSYFAKIPADFYKTEVNNSCVGQVAMRGLNRDTGVADCLSMPVDANKCPAGTFATGIRVDDNSNRLVVNCQPNPTTTATCDPNYALRSLSETSLFNNAKVGKCTWVAADTGNIGVFLGKFIKSSNRIGACPGNYHVDNGCTLVVRQSTNGWCPKIIAGVDQSYSFPPVPGSMLDRTLRGNGKRDVDCQVVNPPPQACPADCTAPCTLPTWIANVQYNGNCVVDSTVATEVDAK